MEEDATSKCMSAPADWAAALECMSAPADWAAALAGWSVADTVSWLHSLPPALQQQLHAREAVRRLRLGMRPLAPCPTF